MNITCKIYLILYNKITKNIVNLDGIFAYNYPGGHYLYMNYDNKSILYDGNVFFNENFYQYISPLKNLDIVLFKFNEGILSSNRGNTTPICNKDYINDPYIATFQLIENIDNSTSGGRNQTLVENAYNEGFERGYNEGVYNTKKQFTETKKQFDSLFNY